MRMGILVTGTGVLVDRLCRARATLSSWVVPWVLLQNSLQKLFTWKNSSALGNLVPVPRNRCTSGARRARLGGVDTSGEGGEGSCPWVCDRIGCYLIDDEFYVCCVD